MLRNVFLMTVRWIVSNRRKYYVSWIAFAVISLFFVIFFSFGSSTFGRNNENRLSIKILSFGNGNMNNIVGMDEKGRDIVDEDLSELTSLSVSRFFNELNANSYRVFHEKSVNAVILPNDKKSDVFTRCYFYASNNGELLFDSEKANGTIIDGIGENTVLVTEDFLKKHDMDLKDAVGKEITVCFSDESQRPERAIFTDGNDHLKITIGGIIQNLNDSALNSVDIYIPVNSEQTDDFLADRADIELRSVLDHDFAVNYLNTKGQRLLRRNYDYTLEQGLNEDFSSFGNIMKWVLFFLVATCFLNTNTEVIESNGAYFCLLHVLGCRRMFLYSFACLMSVIQGLIGTIAGLVLSLIFQKPIGYLLDYMIGDFGNYVTKAHFAVSLKAIGSTFLFCFIITLICGIFACFLVQTKYMTANLKKRNFIIGYIFITFVVSWMIIELKKFMVYHIGTDNSEIICALLLLGISLFLLKIRNIKGEPEHPEEKKLRVQSCVLLAVFVGLIYTVYWAFDASINDLSMIINKEYSYSGEIVDYNALSVIKTILIYVIWSVIAEELLFRKYLYISLRKIGPIKASLITSALFAIMHGFTYHSIMMFVLSMIICFVFEHTGQLTLCMFVHSVWNLAALIFGAVIKIGPVSFTEPHLRIDIMGDMAWCILIGAIAAEAAILLLNVGKKHLFFS